MLAGNTQHQEANLLLQIMYLHSDWRSATLFHFPKENGFLFSTCVSAHLSQHRPQTRGIKKWNCIFLAKHPTSNEAIICIQEKQNSI